MKPTIPTLAGKTTRDVEVAIKRLRDYNDGLERKIAVLRDVIAGRPTSYTLDQINGALSATGTNPLNLTGLVGTPSNVLGQTGGIPLPPTPITPPGVCHVDLSVGQPGGPPAAPSLRWYRGDFCGVTVPGLPPVAGGASDPSVVLSPFLDRYVPADQASIFAAHAANGYTHFLLWWPDSRDAGGVGGGGQTIAQFAATCSLVKAAGFYTVINLFSKVYDGNNPDPAKNDALIGTLTAAGLMDICIPAFEAELFFTPDALQAMIDHVTAQTIPHGIPNYIHFSTGVHSDPPADTPPSVFWFTNVGKLSGLYWQLDTISSCAFWQEGFSELMVRFGAGVSGWPQDSGFGHPFDIVALEYSATARFAGSMSENTAKSVGNQWICAPAVAITSGPYAGQQYVVRGYGNGGPHV